MDSVGSAKSSPFDFLMLRIPYNQVQAQNTSQDRILRHLNIDQKWAGSSKMLFWSFAAKMIEFLKTQKIKSLS